MLTIIAAVAANNVIGNSGTIPWDIPEELALFKQITMGHIIIMGRKTFESIGRELPGRKMFVLSHSPHASTTLSVNPNPCLPDRQALPVRGEGNVTFYTSIQDALDMAKHEQKAFVIGGASVYDQMMSLIDDMHISHIKTSYPGDVSFPAIDPTIWNIAEEHDYPLFTHIRYTRV